MWYDEDLKVKRSDSGYWFQVVDGDTIDFMPELAKTVSEIQGYDEINAKADDCPDVYCSQPFLWRGSDLK